MVKLKTSNRLIINQSVNIPIDGVIKIDEDGVTEVSEEAAAILLNNFDGTYSAFSDEGEDESKDDESKDDEGNKEDENEEDENEEDEIDLTSLSLKELISVAKDAGIKEPTYRKFKESKKLMVKFLKDNI